MQVCDVFEIISKLEFKRKKEFVSLKNALNRVLADDIYAKKDLRLFNFQVMEAMGCFIKIASIMSQNGFDTNESVYIASRICIASTGSSVFWFILHGKLDTEPAAMNDSPQLNTTTSLPHSPVICVM